MWLWKSFILGPLIWWGLSVFPSLINTFIVDSCYVLYLTSASPEQLFCSLQWPVRHQHVYILVYMPNKPCDCQVCEFLKSLTSHLVMSPWCEKKCEFLNPLSVPDQCWSQERDRKPDEVFFLQLHQSRFIPTSSWAVTQFCGSHQYNPICWKMTRSLSLMPNPEAWRATLRINEACQLQGPGVNCKILYLFSDIMQYNVTVSSAHRDAQTYSSTYSCPA